MLNIQALITKYNGKVLDYDGIAADAGQCVQLVEYVLTDKDVGFGLAPFFGNAIDWWNKYGGSLMAFDKVSYSPGVYPMAGDIVIWSGGLPNSGGFGHIDLCIEDGNRDGFSGFDSNWSGAYAHITRHSYSYVVGYLRLKGGEMPYVEQYVIDDYEKWKKMGLFLSQQPAYPAMGGSAGNPLGDPSGIKTVLDDYEQIKQSAHGTTRDSALKYVQDNLK